MGYTSTNDYLLDEIKGDLYQVLQSLRYLDLRETTEEFQKDIGQVIYHVRRAREILQ